MNIERHDPNGNPDHGRPCILSIKGDEGKLAVHVDREHGTLFIYATGPKGGDRGTIVVGAARAHEIRTWLRATEKPLYGSLRVFMWLTEVRGERVIRIGKSSVSMKAWRLTLDEEAEAVLRECLTAWVEQATTHRVDEKVELRVLVKVEADKLVPHEDLAEAVKGRLQGAAWKSDAGYVIFDEVTVS